MGGQLLIRGRGAHLWAVSPVAQFVPGPARGQVHRDTARRGTPSTPAAVVPVAAKARSARLSLGLTCGVSFGEPRRETIDKQVGRLWRLVCRGRGPGGLGRFPQPAAAVEPPTKIAAPSASR
jgi:hypothetical protein